MLEQSSSDHHERSPERLSELLEKSIPFDRPDEEALKELSVLDRLGQTPLFSELNQSDVPLILEALAQADAQLPARFAKQLHRFYEEAGQPRIGRDLGGSDSKTHRWWRLLTEALYLVSTVRYLDRVNRGQRIHEVPRRKSEAASITPEDRQLSLEQRTGLQVNIVVKFWQSSTQHPDWDDLIPVAHRVIDLQKHMTDLNSERTYLEAKQALETVYLQRVLSQLEQEEQDI